MLEKQFGFSSAETGLLMSCNDIGYLSCVLFAGYIARKVSVNCYFPDFVVSCMTAYPQLRLHAK